MKKTLLTKTLLLLCALAAGSSSVWATDVNINFGTTTNYWAAHSSASFTDSDSRSWSRTFSAGSKSSGQAAYSQFGNASNTCTSLVFTATAGSDMTVTAFSVTMAGASGGDTPTTGTIYLYKRTSGGDETQLATASVSGTSDVTCSISSSQSFSNTDILKVSYVGTAKAIRVSQLSYSYTAAGGGGGGSDPSISLNTNSISPTEAENEGTITVTYNNIASVDAEVKFYASDGTTPADYDWLDAEINALDNTKLDYVIAANTGSARTAYMKVHEKNKDVYSSLITITQAAKTVVAPTFSPEGGGASYLQGTGITLTSAGNTIYYNLTTDGSTPDDPTISSTKYTEPIALSSGTNKIKAIAVDAYGNSSSVVSRTYKGIAPTTLPFNWVGTSSAGKDDLAGKTGVSINLPSDYATSNAPYRLKFDGTAKYVIIYTNEKPETVTFTAKLFETASTGSKMKVQASVDGTDYTDIEEFTIKGDANSTFDFTTSNPFNATHRVVKLALSSRNKNVAVGSISVSAAPVPVTITAAEYATYVNTTKPLDFSATGITVYTATDNETSVTLNEVATGKVPANTPVVLYKAGADGTPISVPVIASADAIGGTNDLRVSTGTDVENMYVLAKKPTIGFYPWNGTTDLSAGKIYLQGKASYGAREFLGFGNDSETTGIDKVQVSGFKIQDSEVYNLNGQRVMNPTKGLYIVNGRKVVVK